MSKASHIEFNHDFATYKHEVARNNVPGASLFGGFGERDVPSALTVDLWPGVAAAQPFPPSTGIQMEIVSSDAADTLTTGANIWQIELHYLDAAGDEQVEIVDLGGLTPVNTDATDIRFVQCLHIWNHGGNPVSAGNISLRSVGGATTYSYIPAGQTRCASSARMVPRGKIAYVTGAIGASASGAAKRAILRIHSNAIDGDVVNGGDIFFPQGTSITQDNSTASPFDPPLPFPEFSIIKATAVTTGACFTSVTWFGFVENE